MAVAGGTHVEGPGEDRRCEPKIASILGSDGPAQALNFPQRDGREDALAV